MKKIHLIIILFIGALTTNAQDDDTQFKTLFKQDGKTKVSGFGGLTMEFSGINNEFAYSMGGEGAVLFNQSFFIGGYGMGTVNFPAYSYPQPSVETPKTNIIFGHGGFYTGFVFRPNNPFHFGVSSKFGWGGISMYEQSDYYYPGYPYEAYEVDPVFVITPQVEAELNIARWFKVNMGLGYRIVTGVDATYLAYPGNGLAPVETPYFDSNAFNSVTFQLGFYFGWFK